VGAASAAIFFFMAVAISRLKPLPQGCSISDTNVMLKTEETVLNEKLYG